MDTISGHVNEEAGAHAPIAGVVVCASGNFISTPRCASSDSLGAYTIAGLANDTYRVSFIAQDQGYVGEFYDDEQDWFKAEMVVHPPGADLSGIDAQLAKGGTIAGTVTDVSTKVAIAGVEVCAERDSGGMFGFSCMETGPSGAYLISGLPDGAYRIAFRFFQSDYVSQLYDGKFFWEDATLIPISGASMVAGIHAALERGGGIAGTVTSDATGAPLANIFLCAREGFGGNRIVECELTDNSGRYTLEGLPPGSYKVEFSAPSEVFADDGYPTQYFNLKPTFGEAELVPVASLGIADGIDARLGYTPPAQASVSYAGSIGAPESKKQKSCRRGYRKQRKRGEVRCVKVAKKHARHRRHSG